MSALLQAALYLDTFCDFSQQWTIVGSNGPLVATPGATVTLTVRATPTDPTPILQVSTSSGIALGVALPAPVGAPCTNLAEILATGLPLTLQTTPPIPIAVTVTTTALAALVTTGYTLGQIAFVQAGAGSYFAWSPADANTPNGSTIIQGAGATGNWLLCGTFNLTIPAAAMAGLVGVENAFFDLLVTMGGITTKVVEGPVYTDQTIGGH